MTYKDLHTEVGNLKQQIFLLEEALASSKQQVCEQSSKIDEQGSYIHQLQKLLQGFKSEKHYLGGKTLSEEERFEQLNLFEKSLSLDPEPKEEEDSSVTLQNESSTSSTAKHKRRSNPNHKGRNPIPEHLPTEIIVLEPEESTEGKTQIGEVRTETLKFTPASLVRVITVRPKYRNNQNQHICIADLPERPLLKSYAESSLLAHIHVSKYVDHLPFERQRALFRREFDWHLPKSTINSWSKEVSRLLEPLYNKLKEKLLQASYLQADESPIKVLDRDHEDGVHKGYQWLYHDPEQNIIVFEYQEGRAHTAPKKFLENFQGDLQCDGYSAYDTVASSCNDIKLMGCLAHARRKFVDAQQNDPKRAQYALDLFTKVYHLERRFRKEFEEGNTDILDPSKTEKKLVTLKKQRIQYIKPLLEQLKKWIENEAIEHTILPKSSIGKAFTYYLNQYHKLIRVVEDPRFQLDNNRIENKVRPLALGRKNYLFCGSHAAAQRAAMFYSFFATCKAKNVNPQTWLQETLDKLPRWSVLKLEELLP